MQTHFWWLNFFGSRKEPNVKRRPGFTKMRNLVMRNQSDKPWFPPEHKSLPPKSREHDLEDNARLLSIVLQTYLNTTPTLTATGLLHSNPHSSRCPDSSHTQLTNCSYCLKLLFWKQDSAAWRREFQIFLWTFYFYGKNVFSNATHVHCKNGPTFPLHW